MGTMVAITCILALYAVTNSIWGMQVIPERSYVKYENEKYVIGSKFYIRRHSRRSQYYINLEGYTQQEWGNNVSIDIYFYEFLHNEYKKSFVEMHYTHLCDWIHTDPYVGRSIRDNGCFDVEIKRSKGLPYNPACVTMNMKCPLPAGNYKLNNVSIPVQDFPNVWPFEKCRADVIARSLPSNDTMVELQIYVLVKQKVGKLIN